MLSFYIIFLIPLFLIHPYKFFSIQLEPGTMYLAHTRLIVFFISFSMSTTIIGEGSRMRRINRSLPKLCRITYLGPTE